MVNILIKKPILNSTVFVYVRDWFGTLMIFSVLGSPIYGIYPRLVKRSISRLGYVQISITNKYKNNSVVFINIFGLMYNVFIIIVHDFVEILTFFI